MDRIYDYIVASYNDSGEFLKEDTCGYVNCELRVLKILLNKHIKECKYSKNTKDLRIFYKSDFLKYFKNEDKLKTLILEVIKI